MPPAPDTRVSRRLPTPHAGADIITRFTARDYGFAAIGPA